MIVMKKKVSELDSYSSNEKLKNCEKQFKNYCTIRRDLRDAYKICEYAIDLNENAIKNNTIDSQVFLVHAALMHAIVLYGRWFKTTTGKITLKPNNFFDSNSPLFSSHTKVISYRDEYVAHNQNDILGGDTVWVVTKDNVFIESKCNYEIQLLLSPDEMQQFKECIQTVHNKIDAEEIPKWQRNLNQELLVMFPKTNF